MTHKNIFLSLFVLVNISPLFSMEQQNQTLIKSSVKPIRQMDKLYPTNLNNKNRVKKRIQAMKEAQSKNNKNLNDKENNTINNSNPIINNQTQKNNPSI